MGSSIQDVTIETPDRFESYWVSNWVVYTSGVWEKRADLIEIRFKKLKHMSPYGLFNFGLQN
jgi:hypothetical protein